MKKIRLGKTELMVSASSFGCLPIQRLTKENAKKLLVMAYENGINYFDTANAYSDSEEKIGYALSDVRKNIVISTKSQSTTKEGVLKHISLSLERLQTEYIDLFQFHNPAVMPNPEDAEGAYQGALEAKRRGWVRHIGITNHRLSVAKEAIASGLFETLQFPFSSLATDEDIALTALCKDADLGFIAMKGLSGGLITNAATTFAFIKQFDNVVPIWGIQKEEELAEFIALEKNPPAYDAEMQALIEKDRKELAGNFCRGCGYCMPCPAGIEINTMARMSLLLRRSPFEPWTTEEMAAKMEKIEDCLHCNACMKKCPYKLNTPELLRENLLDYREFRKTHCNA